MDHVLYWPYMYSDSTGPGKNKRMISSSSSGYVIGWDDTDVYYPQHQYHQSLGGASCGSPCNTERSNIQASSNVCRTSVCIGILASDKYEYHAISEAICSIRRKHSCRSNINKYDFTADRNSGGSRVESNRSCYCGSCMCFGRLKIVARFVPQRHNEDEPAELLSQKRDNENVDDVTPSETNQHTGTQDELPTIIVTDYGPWWMPHNKDVSAEANDFLPTIALSERQNNNDKPTSTLGLGQLVLYELCENNLSFRRFKCAYGSSETGNGPMDRTLRRICEAGNVMSELITFMDRTKNDEAEPLSSEEEIKHTDIGKIENQENIYETSNAQNKIWSKMMHWIVVTTQQSCLQRLINAIMRHSFIFKLFAHRDCVCSRSISLLIIAAKELFKRTGTYIRKMPTQEEHFHSRLADVANDESVSGVLDAILGLVFAVLIMKYVNHIQTFTALLWSRWHGILLRKSIAWLETFPIGFKLNVPLTSNVGREIFMILDVHASVSSIISISPLPKWYLMSLAIFTGISGFTAGVALVLDTLRIVVLHLEVIAVVFQSLHRGQMAAMSSLWLLFRGRKKNILRRRSDTMQYDYMQLLLGVILFIIGLFLFTTILVYYIFFSIVNLGIAFIMILLGVLLVGIDHFPVKMLLCRMLILDAFVEDISFSSLAISKTCALCSFEDEGYSIVDDVAEECPDYKTKCQCSDRQDILVMRRVAFLSILLRVYKPIISDAASILMSHIGAILIGNPFFLVHKLSSFIFESSTARTPSLGAGGIFPLRF